MGMFGGGVDDDDDVDRGIWDHPAGPVFPQWVIDAMQRGLARVAAGGTLSPPIGAFAPSPSWPSSDGDGLGRFLELGRDQIPGVLSGGAMSFDTGASSSLPQDDPDGVKSPAADQAGPSADRKEAVPTDGSKIVPPPPGKWGFVLTQDQVDRLTGGIGDQASPISGSQQTFDAPGAASMGQASAIDTVAAAHPLSGMVFDDGGNAQQVRDQLAKLPAYILQDLQNGKLTWHVTNKNVGEYPPFMALTKSKDLVPGWSDAIDKETRYFELPGAYDPNLNAVILAEKPDIGNGSFNMIFHETGHGFDHVMGDLAQSPDFFDAYEADHRSLDPYYNQPRSDFNSRREAFAEAFSRYYAGDATLKERQPKLWDYIRKLDAREAIIPSLVKVDIKPIDLRPVGIK